MKHRYTLIALAASVLLAAAGCGDQATEPEVATAASAAPATTTAAAGDAVAAYVRGMRDWVGCMRKRGVDLPDPDAKGTVDFGDSRDRKGDPVFLRASEQCKDRQPARPAELQATNPPLTAEQIRNARAYAACMRANGVPGFRDPGPDGYPVDEPTAGSAQDPADTDPQASLKAGQICEPVLNGRAPASYDPSVKGRG